MANYAQWGDAFARGAGWDGGGFFSTYNKNRKDAAVPALEASPVACFLLKLARRRFCWPGPVIEIYRKIPEIAGKEIMREPGWPKSVHGFGQELRRLAPQFALHGLSVSFERRRSERILVLKSEGAVRRISSPSSTTAPNASE
jgi:hypothetical protein